MNQAEAITAIRDLHPARGLLPGAAHWESGSPCCQVDTLWPIMADGSRGRQSGGQYSEVIEMGW